MVALNRPFRLPSASGLATRPVSVLLLLAAAAALSYANTFHASFHFDDTNNIVENSQIKSFAAFRDLSGTRYVGFLTFAVNYAVGGLNPVGYHVVNLLIHITNGYLVYALVGLLVRTPAMQAGRGPDHGPRGSGIAAATALLFVVHPLQTQAVTYIVQRFSSLAALFYLLAVVCYLQWRLADPDTRTRYGWYAGALAATLLAMKTKENTFTLPLLLLLLEGICFRPRTWRAWRPLLPFVLTLPLIPLSLPAGLWIGDGDAGLARETTAISRLSYLFTQWRVLVTYLRLVLVPVHQNLDYDYPIYDSLFEPPVVGSGLLLLGLLGLALYLLWAQPRYRLVGLGVLWFFLTVSVESSIIPITDVIFEHRMYLPSVGVLLAASVLGESLLGRMGRAGLVVAGTVVAVLAVATYQRNRVWADEITLWRHVVAESPKKARSYNNLGNAYLLQRQPDDAIAVLLTALQLKADYPEAHMNLGNAYAQQGQVAASIQKYQTALQLRPNYAEAHTNLGLAYAQQGHVAAAIQEHQTALQVRPNFVEAHTNLGVAYARQGQVAAAIQKYQTALQLRPDYAEAHHNLGDAYLLQGRRDDAIQEYRTAIHLKPDLPEPHVNLGNVYTQQGQMAAAIQEYQTALQVRPGYAEAHYNLGNAYLLQGRRDDAIQEYRTAIHLKPDYPEAYMNLGIAYTQQGQVAAAIQEYQTALQFRPDYAEAHTNLGVAYTQQGRFAEAIQEFLVSIRLKPDLPEPHAQLGNAYAQQRRFDDAIQHYQRALQLRSDWVEVRFKLGQVYLRKGLIPDARREFEAIVRLHPDFEPAQQALKQLDGRT